MFNWNNKNDILGLQDQKKTQQSRETLTKTLELYEDTIAKFDKVIQGWEEIIDIHETFKKNNVRNISDEEASEDLEAFRFNSEREMLLDRQIGALKKEYNLAREGKLGFTKGVKLLKQQLEELDKQTPQLEEPSDDFYN